MKQITTAALAGAAVLCAGAANAQQGVDFSKVEIKTTDLGNKTYMLEGQGGNITVAVGSDGIIMVDSQFAPLHDKTKAAIAKISPLPIKYLIITHFHGDHVGDANVVATGDTFSSRNYPNLDWGSGGTIDGMIAATERYLKTANATTKIVPGHGPLATRADLQAFHDMLVTVRDRVEKLLDEGKSEQEVLAANPIADLDAKWAAAQGLASNPIWLRNVYNSLRNHD